jgi:hypothetical protein
MMETRDDVKIKAAELIQSAWRAYTLPVKEGARVRPRAGRKLLDNDDFMARVWDFAQVIPSLPPALPPARPPSLPPALPPSLPPSLPSLPPSPPSLPPWRALSQHTHCAHTPALRSHTRAFLRLMAGDQESRRPKFVFVQYNGTSMPPSSCVVAAQLSLSQSTVAIFTFCMSVCVCSGSE